MANLVALDKIDEEPEPVPEPEPPEPEVPEQEPDSEDESSASVEKMVQLGLVRELPNIIQHAAFNPDSPEIKAVMRLFRHDFRRFAKTEEDKAMRAMSGNKMDGWVKSFYGPHEKFVAQTLATRYGILLAIKHEDGDPEELAKDMAKEYIREARDRIMAGSRNEDIDTLDRFAGIMAVRAVNMALDTQEAA